MPERQKIGLFGAHGPNTRSTPWVATIVSFYISFGIISPACSDTADPNRYELSYTPPRSETEYTLVINASSVIKAGATVKKYDAGKPIKTDVTDTGGLTNSVIIGRTKAVVVMSGLYNAILNTTDNAALYHSGEEYGLGFTTPTASLTFKDTIEISTKIGCGIIETGVSNLYEVVNSDNRGTTGDKSLADRLLGSCFLPKRGSVRRYLLKNERLDYIADIECRTEMNLLRCVARSSLNGWNYNYIFSTSSTKNFAPIHLDIKNLVSDLAVEAPEIRFQEIKK